MRWHAVLFTCSLTLAACGEDEAAPVDAGAPDTESEDEGTAEERPTSESTSTSASETSMTTSSTTTEPGAEWTSTPAASGAALTGTATSESDVASEEDRPWTGLVVAVPASASEALGGVDLRYGAGVHTRAELEALGASVVPAGLDGSFDFDLEPGPWLLCVGFDNDPVELLGCGEVEAPGSYALTHGEGGVQVEST